MLMQYSQYHSHKILNVGPEILSRDNLYMIIPGPILHIVESSVFAAVHRNINIWDDLFNNIAGIEYQTIFI